MDTLIAGEDKTMEPEPPLIAHMIFRLAIGGLENGLVNLINAMPPNRYRHAIVCLTDETEFRERITRPDVPVIALHKKQGHDLGAYLRMWNVFRQLRPAIVHTRNWPTMEFLAVAACAGIQGRIHGEHGRDVYDLDGTNKKYNLVRKAIKPLVHGYIAVSVDLAEWLVTTVGAERNRVTQIYNGVDSRRFYPRSESRPLIGPAGFAPADVVVIGTVGRMQAVKNQTLLAKAFVRLVESRPGSRDWLRLVMIGEGPLREESRAILRQAGVESCAWLPGERNDTPDLMRAMDLFVLPSLAEGISNTILEAMATGLPVVATRVGGNVEIVQNEITGLLVAPEDSLALAEGIQRYLDERSLLALHGRAGRQQVEACHSMDSMVNKYLGVYDSVMASTRCYRTSAYQPIAG
jgi:sugar transferase (PEP-CTERM/EpsH1 system associated)